MRVLQDFVKEDRFFQIVGLVLLILIMVTSLGGYSESFYVFDTSNKKIGFLLFGFSLIFRIWAHVAIGKSYSPTLEVRKDHELVKHGPYKYIRHPIYTGTIIALLAIPIFSSSPLGLFFSLLSIPLFVHRIRNEEKMLIEEYGDEYREYQETTWSLFPYVY